MASKTETPAEAPRETLIHVLDTTAKTRSRVHEVEVKGVLQQLEFKPGKPIQLPFHVAAKFLRHEGFIRTDEHGTPMDWEPLPKQPGDLQAGEKLVLTPDQTVARLSELNFEALQRRAVLLPGGDEIATRPNVTSKELASFIAEQTAKIAKANQRPDYVSDDEYTPPPLSGDDYDAAA